MNARRLVPALTLLLASPLAMAAVSDAEFQALKDSIAVLTQQLAAMEQELAAERAAGAPPAAPAAVAVAPAAPAAGPAWSDTIAWQGDFRYRYENIDEQDKDERNRSRIRARAGLVAKLQPDLETGFGLATGTDGDPVSTNQTLGGGGSRKDIYLDLAYFRKGLMPGLNMTGGKFRNFLYRPGRHQMLWDSDWNPEGLGLVYQGETFFANALGSWLDGDSADGSQFAWGGQAGVRLPFGDAARLTAGIGYYDIDTQGESITFVVDDKLKYFGNSYICSPPDSSDPDDCVYASSYRELEGFAELGFELGSVPASVFVDYVRNGAADANDTGYAAGFTVGQVKGRGSWELSYAYQDLEADAVIGLLTDSDFGGGGTDTRGHLLRGTWGLGDKWNLGLTYFLNEIGRDAGNERDYDRAQVDLNFRY